MDNLILLQNKILPIEKLLPFLSIWRFKEQKIVFTNGCFDLLHLGHIDYLAKAANLGNKLVVGLNTDSSTARLKGAGRPITNEESRSKLLAALFFVDAVVLFDDETPINLIKTIAPDVLVKGADYTLDKIVGADSVLARGGEVKTIEFIDGYSTSAIEQKIRNYAPDK